MSRFDDILRQQTKKAFEGFDVDHLADRGWESFMKSHPGKRRMIPVIPFWTKAASVAVILGLSGLLTYQLTTKQSDSDIMAVSVEIIEAETTMPVEPGEESELLASSRGEESAVTIITDETTKEQSTSVRDILIEEVAAFKISESERKDRSLKGPIMGNSDIVLTGHNILSAYNLRTRSYSEVESLFFEERDDKGNVPGTTLIAGVSGMLAQVDNAMANSPGLAMGFFIDKTIFRGVSIRPGLAIGKYSSGLENSNASSALGFAAPSFSNVTGSVDAYNAELDMLTMEIPVNIVISLWKRGKSSVYFSTGLSTVIYLDQSYSGSASNLYAMTRFDEATGNQVYENTLTKMSFESEYSAFSHVDYFGLANFSAGYSLPIGNNNSLLLEPYVQLPVSDLTSRNIKIRYGGMSFKLSLGK